MKTTASNLIRWAGLSAMIAGICYMLVGVFHPANVASSVTSAQWQVVHYLACAMELSDLSNQYALLRAEIQRRMTISGKWATLPGLLDELYRLRTHYVAASHASA